LQENIAFSFARKIRPAGQNLPITKMLSENGQIWGLIETKAEVSLNGHIKLD